MATAGWSEDWERLAEQMREAMRPLLELQTDVARQMGPVLRLQEDVRRSIAAMTHQVELPSQRLQEVAAAFAASIQLPKVALPPELTEGFHFPASDLAPIVEMLRQISERHRSLGLRLSEAGAAVLDEGFEHLEEVTFEDPQHWTAGTLAQLLDGAVRYHRTLLWMLLMLLTGLIMTSRAVEADPDVMALLEQIDSASDLIVFAAAAWTAAEAARKRDD